MRGRDCRYYYWVQVFGFARIWSWVLIAQRLLSARCLCWKAPVLKVSPKSDVSSVGALRSSHCCRRICMPTSTGNHLRQRRAWGPGKDAVSSGKDLLLVIFPFWKTLWAWFLHCRCIRLWVSSHWPWSFLMLRYRWWIFLCFDPRSSLFLGLQSLGAQTSLQYWIHLKSDMTPSPHSYNKHAGPLRSPSWSFIAHHRALLSPRIHQRSPQAPSRSAENTYSNSGHCRWKWD